MAKGDLIYKVNKHFVDPLERTIENVSKFLGINKREVVYTYHRRGCPYQLVDFRGSSYITKEAQWVYNFIKSKNPELTVELSKRSKYSDNKEIYYQIFIKEKKTVILIDYNLDITKIPYKIIKLNKRAFRDIFSLTRIKLLLIKKLSLNQQIMSNKEIDILDYIEKHKNISKDLFKNELYIKMLSRAMEKTQKRLKIESNNFLENKSKGQEILLSNIREDIKLSKNTLYNLLLYYNKNEEAYGWVRKRKEIIHKNQN